MAPDGLLDALVGIILARPTLDLNRGHLEIPVDGEEVGHLLPEVRWDVVQISVLNLEGPVRGTARILSSFSPGSTKRKSPKRQASMTQPANVGSFVMTTTSKGSPWVWRVRGRKP